MKIEWMTIVTGASVGVGLAASAIAAKCFKEAQECRALIADSNQRIRGMTHVDVDRHIVNDAIRKEVRDQVSASVSSARTEIERNMSADLRNRVRQAIGNKTAEINKTVSDKLSKEISEMDRDEIVRKVVKATTDKLIEKLSDDLDNEIGKIGAVYKGIAAVLE